MYVEYSGWTQEQGSFFCNIFIDATRQDYALVYGDDTVAKQISSFQEVTADWNNDGDVYTRFGAWFESPGYGGSSFMTPEEMVRAVLDGQEKTHFYDNEVKTVQGIEIPPPKRGSAIDDKIFDSERRAANRDADRNRRMAALGIRPPNEPWAR